MKTGASTFERMLFRFSPPIFSDRIVRRFDLLSETIYKYFINLWSGKFADPKIKLFDVVLNRAWNKLLNQGFIDDSKQSNK